MHHLTMTALETAAAGLLDDEPEPREQRPAVPPQAPTTAVA